ncbi:MULTISPECIES: hypothetical protein [unclassified Frankia]|uniref:AMIN-like domain-containing (lipo)protein n=1 Tax=unclassified Frankia TaxID=2632575 RepID=UPI0004618A28|nr:MULTISPECIES: hypothetical protein [unclassified Frankia]KDA41738.1 hypothetical protein BMG523Draft_03425 [Frankia sp. BMG5.23]ORT47224.1 hypothetical protein KBI5_20960 [Frankia sp. KB5]
MRRIAAAISAVLLLTLSLVFTEAGVSRAAPPVTPVLMHIRFAHAASARVDIVTFVFRPSAPKDVRAEYVPRSGLIQDGSGNRVFVLGRSFVKVTFHNSAAHNIEGRPAAPRNLFPLGRTTNVVHVKQGGDFEGVVTYYLGLCGRRPAPPAHPTVSSVGRDVILSIPTR